MTLDLFSNKIGMGAGHIYIYQALHVYREFFNLKHYLGTIDWISFSKYLFHLPMTSHSFYFPYLFVKFTSHVWELYKLLTFYENQFQLSLFISIINISFLQEH